jgi:hypothetical protein
VIWGWDFGEMGVGTGGDGNGSMGRGLWEMGIRVRKMGKGSMVSDGDQFGMVGDGNVIVGDEEGTGGDGNGTGMGMGLGWEWDWDGNGTG